ncbi:hypothetical protein SCLCIDRAFT_855161 [Scleroderma citrinum Foug A]|uniref:Major facilitator superfamily (MFS) profile domain-containing protein n=1 Tax=Scleroderma citrinum Foug A TaxID=1036808 RepID=A0A0C3CP95_9AGAM|nr:hypothetical protein SCLCIDRAFT_855161 [Scleroderma citrinum Foug A]
MVEDFGSIKQQETQKSGLVEAFTDWTVWWLAIARSMAIVGESFSNFFPTLAATIGYDPSITLLICAPPWILAMATAYCVSQHSDATRERFWHIAVLLCGGIVGFTLGILTMNPAVRYLSLLLMAQTNVSYVVFYAWHRHCERRRIISVASIVGSIVLQIIHDLHSGLHNMHFDVMGISITPYPTQQESRNR